MRIYRNVLYAAVAVLLATGIAWEFVQAGAARTWLMRAHGAAAMTALFAFGGLLARHLPPAWAAGAKRSSGIAAMTAALWLAVTGYLLYYSGSDAVRDLASQTHLWVGLILCGTIGVHIHRFTSRSAAG